MTKFGKAGKTGPSGFLFWTIRFWQFKNKTMEGAELEDWKILSLDDIRAHIEPYDVKSSAAAHRAGS
jgi:hypothetical protein